MLHGCTQDPDDFAAGTGMNQHAAEQGFFVLYPAQSAAANASRCWNWFAREHQQRDRGEPALIAGLTRAVMDGHAIDARRVYVAGLSAGGAMAAIVAAAYPEIYAAAGVHSGLARGAALDLPSALVAMRSTAPAPRQRRGRRLHMPGPVAARQARSPTPRARMPAWPCCAFSRRTRCQASAERAHPSQPG